MYLLRMLLMAVTLMTAPQLVRAQETSEYDFEAEGFLFRILSGSTVELARNIENPYKGDIVVPEHVEYDGTTYTVTSVDYYAFASSEVTTAVIPGTIKEVKGCFIGAFKLTSVIFCEGVEVIGRGMFNNCTSLTDVSLPESLISIEQGAFYGCQSLPHIVLPEGITYLDYNTFNGCTALAYVQVKAYDFYDGGGIAHNTFSDETYDCAVLYVPEGRKDYYANSPGWKNFKTIVEGEEPDPTLSVFYEEGGVRYHMLSRTRHTMEVVAREGGYAGEVTIPSTVRLGDADYQVTAVADNAFRDCQDLTGVVIEDGLESIGEYAFGGCRNMTSMRLPNTLKYIEEQAINKGGLQSISIPGSVEWIARYAFTDNEHLERVVLGEGINKIGNIFSGCTSLRNVSIPSTVKLIDVEAFSGCGFEELDIPEGVETIAWDAFRECRQLVSVSLPTTATSIHAEALSGCQNSLRHIRVAAGNPVYDSREDCNALIETASNKLLMGCPATAIPASVQVIGRNAFKDCEDLTAIDIPVGVKEVEAYAFKGCTKLEQVSLPWGLQRFGYEVFNRCERLAAIQLPKSLREIGYSAFRECSSLTRIDIPESVQTIGWNAFWECSALDTVYVMHEEPIAINENVFSPTTYERASFFVPEGSEDKYANAEGWGNFGHVDNPDETMGVHAVRRDVADGVRVEDGRLTVESLPTGETVRVYTLDGRQVATLWQPGTVALQPGHLYIIRMSGQTMKVKL